MEFFLQDKRLPSLKKWIGIDHQKWVLTLGKRYLVMATLYSHLLNGTQTVFVDNDMKFTFSSTLAFCFFNLT